MNATSTITLVSYLEQQRLQVDSLLERLLPAEDTYPSSIHRAMRHSVFAGGKRLRPLLCLEAGRLFGPDDEGLWCLAGALEFIHTYSLIHDDLPALDNDDLRRGRPTCHRVFGEATAILAGDALLTLAFEIIATLRAPSAERTLRLIRELAHAIGTLDGMIGGQVVDLESSGRAADEQTLHYIHAAKTGAFLCAALRCGALHAGAAETDIERLTHFGEKIGLSFQIADDLLDVLGTDQSLGKTAGKDAQAHKVTFPAVYGIEESKRIAQRLVGEACAVLAPYAERGRRLEEVAHYLIARKS